MTAPPAAQQPPHPAPAPEPRTGPNLKVVAAVGVALLGLGISFVVQLAPFWNGEFANDIQELRDTVDRIS